MQSLRRSSHFPSVFALIFPFLTLILPLLLAHFKLSHVGGCQTGAPQCVVSLIRTDRHQRESTACVSAPWSRRLIFIFIFPLPEFFPKTSERRKKSSSVLGVWIESSSTCSPFLAAATIVSCWWVSLPCFLQSRLGSQSDAMAIQSIRNVRGNSFCVDCDAPSMCNSTLKRLILH